MKKTTKRWLCVISAFYWAPGVWADYKADIGYSELQQQLGLSTPNGSGVNVMQVEASLVANSNPAFPVYAPDTGLSQFFGKTFHFPATASSSPSGHAIGVGGLFYGNNAIASGIDNITGYEVNQWLDTISFNSVSAPVNAVRVVNHSWVGKADTSQVNGAILRLVDREVQFNETVQVVGMANSASNSPLLGSAYNAIAVGRTDGTHDLGSDAVDTVYVAGRGRPDLVAPQSTTSFASPVVAAAAALLVETGHNGALALSKGSHNVVGVSTIYNAERAETVKAALMAGADRTTDNSSTTAEISDYRNSGHQTANGLDDRFGAGQVNVLNSYQIIAAGEQDSVEDGGSGLMGSNGFDYDASFGGNVASNRTATYRFSAADDAVLSASLVWNLGIANNDSLAINLHDLNLQLIDVTGEANLIASSASSIDNTENLWVHLLMGHDYELVVRLGENNNFSWDYSLAWHSEPIQAAPVPAPAAIYLFVSALAGIGFTGRRKA